MRSKNTLIVGFATLALIQIGVPLYMIARREATLRNGAQYKFRTAPVDPADPFRGRYVALRMEQQDVPVPKGSDYRRGERVYATLAPQPDGFTRIDGVSRSRPDGPAFIKTRVRYPNTWSTNSSVSLDLPFDRYYMNEKCAPEAEKAYWDNSRRTNQNAYVTVRVRNGSAVLEGLYIGDKTIEEFIRK
jgi:uncharacterized membrane-anchored protein